MACLPHCHPGRRSLGMNCAHLIDDDADGQMEMSEFVDAVTMQHTVSEHAGEEHKLKRIAFEEMLAVYQDELWLEDEADDLQKMQAADEDLNLTIKTSMVRSRRK